MSYSYLCLMATGFALCLIGAIGLAVQPSFAEVDPCCCAQFTVSSGSDPTGDCPDECSGTPGCSGVIEPILFTNAKCKEQTQVPVECALQVVNMFIPAKKCEQTGLDCPEEQYKCHWVDAGHIQQQVTRCSAGTPCAPSATNDC